MLYPPSRKGPPSRSRKTLCARGWRPGLPESVALLGNLVGNVPAVVLLLPFLPPRPETGYTVALTSTFAGNAMLIGSIANLIVAEQAVARCAIKVLVRRCTTEELTQEPETAGCASVSLVCTAAHVEIDSIRTFQHGRNRGSWSQEVRERRIVLPRGGMDRGYLVFGLRLDVGSSARRSAQADETHEGDQQDKWSSHLKSPF
jgi:hypothetical protein